MGGGLQMGCSVAGGDSACGSASAGGANDWCLVVLTLVAVQPESMCSLIRESGTLRWQMGHSVNREPRAMVVLMALPAAAVAKLA